MWKLRPWVRRGPSLCVAQVRALCMRACKGGGSSKECRKHSAGVREAGNAVRVAWNAEPAAPGLLRRSPAPAPHAVSTRPFTTAHAHWTPWLPTGPFRRSASRSWTWTPRRPCSGRSSRSASGAWLPAPPGGPVPSSSPTQPRRPLPQAASAVSAMYTLASQQQRKSKEAGAKQALVSRARDLRPPRVLRQHARGAARPVATWGSCRLGRLGRLAAEVGRGHSLHLRPLAGEPLYAFASACRRRTRSAGARGVLDLLGVCRLASGADSGLAGVSAACARGERPGGARRLPGLQPQAVRGGGAGRWLLAVMQAGMALAQTEGVQVVQAGARWAPNR